MTLGTRAIGLITAVFAVVGIGVGAVGYIGTDWATTVFLLQATGETATRFGPVFVALVAFQVALLALLVGPLLAAVLGVLVGSQQQSQRDASLVTAAGTFAGFLVMCLIAVPIAGLGVGSGATVPYSLVGFVGRLVLAALPTVVVGGVAGAVGVAFTG